MIIRRQPNSRRLALKLESFLAPSACASEPGRGAAGIVQLAVECRLLAGVRGQHVELAIAAVDTAIRHAVGSVVLIAKAVPDLVRYDDL
jgi:hypothetical protein